MNEWERLRQVLVAAHRDAETAAEPADWQANVLHAARTSMAIDSSPESFSFAQACRNWCIPCLQLACVALVFVSVHGTSQELDVGTGLLTELSQDTAHEDLSSDVVDVSLALGIAVSTEQ